MYGLCSYILGREAEIGLSKVTPIYGHISTYPLPLKDNANPTGLVLFWENLVENFYSIAPNGVFKMSNRAP